MEDGEDMESLKDTNLIMDINHTKVTKNIRKLECMADLDYAVAMENMES